MDWGDLLVLLLGVWLGGCLLVMLSLREELIAEGIEINLLPFVITVVIWPFSLLTDALQGGGRK